MVSAYAIRTVVGIIGNVISLGLFLSPVPTFIQIWKKGSVEQYSPIPYLATLINCMVWTFYGVPIVHPDSTLVWTINGSGTLIEIVYIVLFFIFSDKKKRLVVALVVAVEIVFMGVLVALVINLAHDHTKRSLVVGIVAIVFNVFMYAAPLSVMKLVITTKSVEYMPFFLSFDSFANGVAWTTYALIRFDPFITIPNSLGTAFSLAQLILYAVYYKSTQRQLAERKVREVNLSEVTVNDDTKKIAGRTTQNVYA